MSGAGENRDLPASHSICCSGATQSSSTDDADYAAAGRAELDRKRHRIENQTPEQTQADRARHRQINQTLEQIEAHRVRQLRINQTPEQAEADRARHRQTNQTPERQNEQRERVSAIRRRPPQHNIARRPFTDNQIERHQLGRMNQQCRHCGAKMWLGESASMCCGNGRVCLPALEPPPGPLNRLLLGQDRQSTEFRSKIRAYNSVLSFTSVGARIDEQLATGRQGVFTYRLKGELIHRIGSLLPAEGNAPAFLQMYIYDTQNEVDNRMAQMRDRDGADQLDRTTLEELMTMLRECNPYVAVFRQAIDVISENAPVNLRIIRSDVPGADRRRYNKPLSADVAVLMPGDGNEGIGQRDIIVSSQHGPLQRIYDNQPSYAPLAYVLLFPLGEQGWSHTMQNENRRKITMMDFSAYRLQVRDYAIIPHAA